jgi:hypothetical protein
MNFSVKLFSVVALLSCSVGLAGFGNAALGQTRPKGFELTVDNQTDKKATVTATYKDNQTKEIGNVDAKKSKTFTDLSTTGLKQIDIKTSSVTSHITSFTEKTTITLKEDSHK